MIHIDNLYEKELLIAHYFCDWKRSAFTRAEVFQLWTNWFKNDFCIKKKSVFCIVDDELVYQEHIKQQDEEIRKENNHTFQNIYKYVDSMLKEDSHDRAYFKEELKALRNRSYGRVIRLTKPLGFYLTMSKSFDRLADFKIMKYGEKGHIITSGDCDKMINYLQNVKNEKFEEQFKKELGETTT